MTRVERGTVVEVRGSTALVRIAVSAACADCASAGSCRGAGGEERLLEARNGIGAGAGDTVRVAIATTLATSPALLWTLAVALLLAGAAVVPLLGPRFLPPALVGNAAGIGGILGAAIGLLAGWGIRRARGGRPASRPAAEITGVERPPERTEGVS